MKNLFFKFVFILLLLIFLPELIYAQNGVSLALDKKGNFYLLSHAMGILYKLNHEGKIDRTVTDLNKGNRTIPLKNINFLGSDSFGNIYAFNFENVEILKLNDNLEIESSWFINFNLKALPSITIGSNDKIFVRLPFMGFAEYSPQGQIITQLLEEPQYKIKNSPISIGARGKIAAYNRKKILIWFTIDETSEVFNIDMETGNCNREAFGSYINFLAFDNKGRIIILAPSWIQVIGFFNIKGNTDIYKNSLSPGAIAIDNLNNYYVYNLDSNEILIIKDTGKISKIISLDENVKIK